MRKCALLLSAIVLTASLTSCMSDGKSAYDIAVEQGFSGDEESERKVRLLQEPLTEINFRLPT